MSIWQQYKNLIGIGIFAVIAFLVGHCQGTMSGESADRRAWEKEKKELLRKADSIENAAGRIISRAMAEQEASENRERSALIIIEDLRRLDSIEDVKFKAEIRHWRSFLDRPAKDLQELMIKEYEAFTDSTALH